MQFTVSFDPDSPDLGLLTGAEQQAILDVANAAAAIWARYLTSANITLDLQITIDNGLYSGNTLAIGGPRSLIPTGGTFNGEAVYEPGSSLELRTGQDPNGSDADLAIGLTVDAIRDMYFKTDPYGAVPSGSYDALSVFLHEIAHGLGIVSTVDDAGFNGATVYDSLTVTYFENTVPMGHWFSIFTGSNTQAVAAKYRDGITPSPISVEPFDKAHLAVVTFYRDLLSVSMESGGSLYISDLDLAILQDLGVPLRQATAGDDVLYAVYSGTVTGNPLYLGAGNDIGFAIATEFPLISGSIRGSTIYGEDGDDRLFGNQAGDFLYGGNGDDYFEGRGGNDSINGDAGTDVVRYSGLASDYQLTRITRTWWTIKDLRPGSPDGTDEIHDVEYAKWGDGTVSTGNTPPQVGTGLVEMPKNSTLPLLSLFRATDRDGDTLVTYQLWDSTREAASGHFVIDGVAQPAGTVITITAAQFATGFFVAGTIGDQLQIRAFDGFDWSAADDAAWSPFSVKIVNLPPFATASDIVRPANQSLAVSSLFSVADPNGLPITHYRLRDNTPDPNSGYFIVDGVAKAPLTMIEITAAQMANSSFMTGTAVPDNITISAFNGFFWSTTSAVNAPPFNISLSGTLNYRPELTLGTRLPGGSFINPLGAFSARRNQTLAPSEFSFTWDRDGDPITKYEIRDMTSDPASGHWIVNGVPQAAGQAIELSPAQWALTSFVTGSVGDELQMRVSDGRNWNSSTTNGLVYTLGEIDWTSLEVSVTNMPPALITQNLTRSHFRDITLSDLFSASDADSDTIIKYQLWDATRDDASGYFTVSGVKQAAGTIIEITAAQLAQTSFVTGSIGDRLEIRAFDGYAWSAGDNAAWSPLTVTVTANNLPVVTTSNTSKAHLQTLSLSSLFSVSDADSDTITKYQLWDGTRDGLSGYFVVNGVQKAAGTVIEISAGQVAQTSFVTGKANDALQIRAFDGIAWSAGDNAAWSPFTVSVPANNTPVVTTGTINPMHGRTLALSSLFSVSDADSDAMTRYQLWDSSRDGTSGYFTVGGVKQAAGMVIDITTAQLAQTSFVTGSVGDQLQIRAFDGISWSAGDNAAWAPFNVTVTPYTAPTLTTNDQAATAGQSFTLSSLIFVTDTDGDTMTRYQLWDSSRDASSGHWIVNGVDQAAGTVIDITAAQLAQTSFQAGTLGDSLQVRAFDGISWTAGNNAAWAPFHINV